MIIGEKEVIRTDVENLFLQEMVQEDANLMIIDRDGYDDDLILDDTSDNLFADDCGTYDDDEEIEDTDLDAVLGIVGDNI